MCLCVSGGRDGGGGGGVDVVGVDLHNVCALCGALGEARACIYIYARHICRHAHPILPGFKPLLLLRLLGNSLTARVRARIVWK